MAVPFYIPTCTEWEAQFLHILVSIWYGQSFSILSILILKYVVVTHCSFNLHFLNDKWCWISFHYLSALTCQLCIFSVIVLFNILCIFFFLGSFVFLMSFQSSFCIFWIQILYQIYALQRLAPSLELVFSFSQQCVLKRRRFQCFFFLIVIWIITVRDI